jgi:SNF2 family DNA or RNA helicase
VTTLWRHQADGVEYAAGHEGCLWYVGLGAGKTLMALTLIRRLGGPVLVVCPKAVIPTWQREAERHYGDAIEVVTLTGSIRGRARELQGILDRHGITNGRPLVVVTNYEAVWREPLAATVLAAPWSLVVADEVHRLKAAGGKASRFMARLGLRVPRRLGLSGTPCPHSPLDAYGVWRFLDPEVFGTSFARFRNRYAIYEARSTRGGQSYKELVSYQRTDEFNERFYRSTFRVDRDVLDLPEEHHAQRIFELPAKARGIYRRLERDFIADLESGTVVAAHALTRLLRLQQVACGYLPVTAVDGETIGYEPLHGSRREALVELLDELPPEEPVVVFCRFRRDLDEIHAAALSLDRWSLELSGRRDDLVAWLDGGAPILAVQIQSGAEGIDLTRAAVAIYYSLDWSLGRYEQSLRRIHRPGQERAVTYVHLLAAGTVDESIATALAERRDILAQILADRRTAQAQ